MECYEDKITLTVDRPKLTPEDEKKLMQVQPNNKVSEKNHQPFSPGIDGAEALQAYRQHSRP